MYWLQTIKLRSNAPLTRNKVLYVNTNKYCEGQVCINKFDPAHSLKMGSFKLASIL